MLKKLFLLAITLLLCLGIVTGCSSDGAKSNKKKSIVCTIFPEYDWVRQIVNGREDEFDITLLLNNGTDLHNYQPTADDMIKISSCDLLIYVGGESDGWIEDAIKTSVNKNMKTVNLMEILKDSLKEEEVVEGMEAEEEKETAEGLEAEKDEEVVGKKEAENTECDGEEEGPEYDEHVWLSLRNSAECVKVISSEIGSLDSEGASVYSANADKYIEELKSLDAEYVDTVKNATVNTLIFGDRFPFRYMTENYGLKYYAAFLGCSAETEASFETITFLSNKVDELSLKYIFVLENSDTKIASTIISNTKNKGQEILVLDSLQSVTSKDIENGATYLGIMRSNLETLKKALN